MSLLRITAILLLGGALFSHGNGAHAQQSREQLARGLPSSNLSGTDVQATQASLLAAPGFARARVASNPAAADATAVGEATCTSCHQLEADHFTHTLHSLGLHAANQADASVPSIMAGSQSSRPPTWLSCSTSSTRLPVAAAARAAARPAGPAPTTSTSQWS